VFVDSVDAQREFVGFFKAAARDHILKMMLDIMQARPGIIGEVLQKVNIVVSTCAAWCQWRSGGIKGNMGQALGQRTPVIYIMDAMEGYSVDQVLAATASDETDATLVMIGDVHQRLSFNNPTYPPVPWISNDPCEGVAREMHQQQLFDLGAEGVDAEEGAPPSQEPSSASLTRGMRTPELRHCSD